MAYLDTSTFTLPIPIVLEGGVNAETITTNKTLTVQSSTYQLLKNTTGALDCVLPSPKDGLAFWVKSRASSSSNIVVKDHSGSTVATLAVGKAVLVVSTSSAWWDVITG